MSDFTFHHTGVCFECDLSVSDAEQSILLHDDCHTKTLGDFDRVRAERYAAVEKLRAIEERPAWEPGPETYPGEYVQLLSFQRTALGHLREKLATTEAERDDARAEYDSLSDLLRRRFPRNPDGSLPDFKVEDVLKENERLRAAIRPFATGNTMQTKNAGPVCMLHLCSTHDCPDDCLRKIAEEVTG